MRIREIVIGVGIAVLVMLGATESANVAAPAAVQSAVDDSECGKCGDGYCNPRCGETATSCPRDCGGGSTSVATECGKCGDGYCNPRCGETSTSCPRDCGGGSTSVAMECGKCGDGYCNPRCGETATNCPRDCGTSATAEDCAL